MKDIAPNVATVVMGIKDKVTGGNDYTPIWNNPEWATPQNVEAFFHNRADTLKNTIDYSEKNGEHNYDAQYDLRMCQKARNVVNAIRLNGPTALIRQVDRWSAANTVADITVGKVFDEKGNYDEDRAKKHKEVETLIAASLGHKSSIKELKKQQEN